MSFVTAEHMVGARDPAGDGKAVPEWRVLGRLEKTAIGSRAADGVTRAVSYTHLTLPTN